MTGKSKDIIIISDDRNRDQCALKSDAIRLLLIPDCWFVIQTTAAHQLTHTRLVLSRATLSSATKEITCTNISNGTASKNTDPSGYCN
eukprot:m.136250 g.136250  ORF g.136250 m.136250 type:complete len:88 (-) comp29839_c0_seq7:3902-4165(-)